MGTYTYTSTRSSTRVDVVTKQFERGLSETGASKKEIQKVLEAIRNKEVSAVGIYAIERKSKKRVAEVELTVDWDKHTNLVRIMGDQFDFTRGINQATGETAETRVYIDALIELARQHGMELHSWIRVAPSIVRGSQKHKQILRKLGYTGGPIQEWKSDPVKMSDEGMIALEEMNIQLTGVQSIEDRNSNGSGVVRQTREKVLGVLSLIGIIALWGIVFFMSYRLFSPAKSESTGSTWQDIVVSEKAFGSPHYYRSDYAQAEDDVLLGRIDYYSMSDGYTADDAVIKAYNTFCNHMEHKYPSK